MTTNTTTTAAAAVSSSSSAAAAVITTASNSCNFLNFHLNVTNCNQSQPPHYTSLIGKSLQLDQKHNVVVEEVIAEGGFGVIFLVKQNHEHHKVKYALKRVVVNSERDYANVSREVAIMSTLSPNTPHILASLTHMVHMYGQSTYEVQNLMPLCKQNLHQVASSRMSKQSSFTEQELLQIINQVSIGLQYLHQSSPPIIHRDIKIENILMLDDLFVLSDFGSATTKQWDPTSDSIQAIQEDLDKHTTLQYRSPEMVDLYGDRGVLGVASDIWALGVCGYKLMCFKDPFESILAIQNRNLNWGLKGKYSNELVQFCECLMAEYQVVRPNVDEVIRVSCSAMQGGDNWNGLEERVSKIKEDAKGREEELSRSKNNKVAAVVLETTVTPRQRPKRGAQVASTQQQVVVVAAAATATAQPNNNNNNGSSATTATATPAAVLPPPLAPPKSPKPAVSPGDHVGARFFSSPAHHHHHHHHHPQQSTISPIPPPHLTPSPSPQPSAPPHSWNPFDEDYQQPPPTNNKHCDNDSIHHQNNGEGAGGGENEEEEEDDDDPFAKAPFDYFKYQPIMMNQQQLSDNSSAAAAAMLQQPYYAPNNPFLYDVHSSNDSTNNTSAALMMVSSGVCNLSFDDNDQQQQQQQGNNDVDINIMKKS